jgi:hypothetical protein
VDHSDDALLLDEDERNNDDQRATASLVVVVARRMGWRQRAGAWLERAVSKGLHGEILAAWSRVLGGVWVQTERGGRGFYRRGLTWARG